MSCWAKTFGEYVCKLEVSADLFDSYVLMLNTFTYVVVSYVDMLGFGGGLGVGGKGNSWSIVFV